MQHRGDHDIAFYEAALEETYELGVSTAFDETSDDDGPLIPGRYLIQLVAPTSSATLAWVHAGAFEKGASLGGTADAGTKRFPLSGDGVKAVEFHVLKGYSDRIGVIAEAGTGRLLISRVSTRTDKGVG